MTATLRRFVRRRTLVPTSRMCAAGLHPHLAPVRVRVAACDLGTCPGRHPAERCRACGATRDVLTGRPVRGGAR